MSIGGILLTVLLLSILVLVHELGHFIAAKLMGIRVLEFALFMGPKIFSFKKGDTVYSLRCIPLGGFCSMEGEEKSSDDERAYSNKPWYKKALVLIAGPAMNILLALILTVVFFVSSGYGTPRISEVIPNSEAEKIGLSKGDKIIRINDMNVYSDIELVTYEKLYEEYRDFEYTIKKADGSEIKKNAISYSKLKLNDKEEVIAINDEKVNGKEEIEKYEGENRRRKPFVYTVEKVSGEEMEFEAYSSDGFLGIGFRTSRYSPRENGDLRMYVTGVKADSLAGENGVTKGDRIVSINGKICLGYEYPSVLKDTEYPRVIEIEKESGEILKFTIEDEAAQWGGMDMAYMLKTDAMDQGIFTFLGDTGKFTYSLIRVTVKSLSWLITGRASVNEMTGPVGIVSIVNDSVTSAESFASGLFNFILLAILISVNLGVFNILPFPALDGGRLVFAIIEGIRGKKIKPEHEGIVSLIGFAILILLSVLVFINDIVKLFQ